MKRKLCDLSFWELRDKIMELTGQCPRDPYDLLSLRQFQVGPYGEGRYYALSRCFIYWANPESLKIPGSSYYDAMLRCYLLELMYPREDDLADKILMGGRISNLEIDF